MTRKRLWYEGGIFHITARGNRREHLFKNRIDYLMYLEILEEALDYYRQDNFKLVCYCLMTNHIHFIIKTDKMPISNLMRRINSRYALYFNKKYNFTGHLFEGRYYSKAIGSIGQLMENSRYIHLNPVRAKIVCKPENYEWSSYNDYIGTIDGRIIDNEIIMDNYKPDRKHRLYKEFTEVLII